MQGELRNARDAAIALHDAAVSRHSPNFDAAFAAAMSEAIERLERVIADVERDPLADLVEVSKTCRWLGDAWFDHGRHARRPSWERGAEAYLKAERLLAGRIAPVEQAKLDFNFGNTLRQLSEGTNVGLLEAAEARYDSAAKAFRDNHLSNFATMVSAQLGTLRPQLRLAREQAVMRENHKRIGILLDRFPTAGKVEQAEIAGEIGRTVGSLNRDGLAAASGEAVAAVTEAARSVPEMEPQLAQLKASVEGIQRVLAAARKPQGAASEATDPMIAMGPAMAALLVGRIEHEVKADAITADRAALLTQLLDDFMRTVPAADDDLRSREQKTTRMREIMARLATAMASQSRRDPPPASASQAEGVEAMLGSLQQFLLQEMVVPMRPAYEREAAREVFAQVAALRAQVRQAASQARDAEAGFAGIEEQAWRVALETHQYARRYHVTVAKPDFAMLAEQAPVRNLFVSGGEDLRAAAQRLSKQEGLHLLLDARRDDVAQERWSQLLAASVGVFDLRLPDGPTRAQAAYDLGLALALGKSCVIAVDANTPIPFDVEFAPVVLGDDAVDNTRRLRAGVYEALSAITRGGRTPQSGNTGRAALDALRRHITGSGGVSDQLSVHLRMAEANAGDAVALNRSLQNIVGSLGAGGPALLFPAWPPPTVLPATGPPRCFHVMPFSKDWSNATRGEVSETCRRQEWTYVRGDDSQVQRIVPAIWQEICLASSVVIDITGHNPNVALELGLVHALGRPYRVVVQDRDPRRHAFPSLAKVQLHAYRIEAAYRGARPSIVRQDLVAVGAQGEDNAPKTLAEIVGPFLAGVQRSRARG
jgi:hypothetical protein